jgi:hypothetical protein
MAMRVQDTRPHDQNSQKRHDSVQTVVLSKLKRINGLQVGDEDRSLTLILLAATGLKTAFAQRMVRNF